MLKTQKEILDHDNHERAVAHQKKALAKKTADTRRDETKISADVPKSKRKIGVIEQAESEDTGPI